MSIAWTNERRKLGDLIAWPRNPRQINKEQAKRLDESFTEFGQVETIAIGPANEVYNGHQRLNVLAAKHGKDYEVEVRVASRALTEKEREKLTVLLHKGAAGEWNFDVLANEFDADELVGWGFTPEELGMGERVDDAPLAQEKRASLADRFIVPPFSVLDARQGYWQDRKRAWLALGIQSELGRGNENLGMSHPETTSTIDFYSQKRKMETELGHEITKGEAALRLSDMGKLKDARAANRERERERVTRMAMHNDPMQRKAQYDASPDAMGKT